MDEFLVKVVNVDEHEERVGEAAIAESIVKATEKHEKEEASPGKIPSLIQVFNRVPGYATVISLLTRRPTFSVRIGEQAACFPISHHLPYHP